MSFLMKLTSVGATKIAAANAGDPIELTEMAAGDGDGAAVAPPTGTETELVNEVWRGDLTSLSVSVADPQVMIAEAVVPTAVGPFTLREIGIFDVDGDLIAYGNFPETYKPAPIEGSARELLIRASLRVASTDNVTILVDESAIFATQAWSNGRFLQIAANLADLDDAVEALNNLGAAPLSGPVFTDNPRAPTPAAGDDDTSIATTAFVKRFFDTVDMTQIGADLPLSGNAPGFTNIPETFRCLLIEFANAKVSDRTTITLDYNTSSAFLASAGFSWFRDNAANSGETIYGAAVIFGYRRKSGLHLAQATLMNNISLGFWASDTPIKDVRIKLDPGKNFTQGTARLWGF